MANTLTIAIAPSGPKTAPATIRALLAQAAKDNISIKVRAFYRDLSKAPEEFTSNPNFEAVKGDIADATTLNFAGVDSIVTITPPTFASSDIVKEAEKLSTNVRQAIEKAGGVKKLVLLSSGAAHLDQGVVSIAELSLHAQLTNIKGEIKTNNAAERMLRDTAVSHKTFVRCSSFMENWTMFPDGLKAPEPFFYSTITPLDYRIGMVAVKDIGAALAREALTIPKGEKPLDSAPHIYELNGPEDYTPNDVKTVLDKLMGKEVEIRAVEQKDLDEFYGHIFPPDEAANWAEMSKCFLPGGYALQHPPKEEESQVVRGTVGLEEALGDSLKSIL